MYVVIALVLGLLGVLGVVGFFILRGMILDAAALQQKDEAEMLAEIHSTKTSLDGLRLQVVTLSTQMTSLCDRLDAHMNETLVPPVSLRGEDVRAALAAQAAGGSTPPPHSGKIMKTQ